MNVGGSGTISEICVDCISRISRRLHRSFSSYLTPDLFPSTTIWGFPLITLFIGANNLIASNIIKDEWRSFLTVVWKLLICTIFSFNSSSVSTLYTFYLSLDSLTVRFLASNSNHIIYLCMLQRTYSLSRLFCDV